MSYLKSLLTDQRFNFENSHYQVTELDVGILHIEPKEKVTSKVLLSCGIHGNETAPIEIVDDILNDLITGKQKNSCELMLIFGSIPGMKKASRYLDFNLNRLFSGVWKTHADAQEAKRAEVIEKHVVNFFKEKLDYNLHLDLHTALFPSHHLRFAIVPKKEKAFEGINRLKTRLGITYPILLAQHGTENKKLANKKLPMLNHILSYPTTIF